MLGPGFQKKNSMISFSRFIVWTRRATARAAATAWAWPSPNAPSRYTRAASQPTTDPKAACASACVCIRSLNSSPCLALVAILLPPARCVDRQVGAPGTVLLSRYPLFSSPTAVLHVTIRQLQAQPLRLNIRHLFLPLAVSAPAFALLLTESLALGLIGHVDID